MNKPRKIYLITQKSADYWIAHYRKTKCPSISAFQDKNYAPSNYDFNLYLNDKNNRFHFYEFEIFHDELFYTRPIDKIEARKLLLLK